MRQKQLLFFALCLVVFLLSSCTNNQNINYDNYIESKNENEAGITSEEETMSSEEQNLIEAEKIINKYYSSYFQRDFATSYFLLLDKEKEAVPFDDYLIEREDTIYENVNKMIEIYNRLEAEYNAINILYKNVEDNNSVKFIVEISKVDLREITRLTYKPFRDNDLYEISEIIQDLEDKGNIPMITEKIEGVVIYVEQEGYIDFKWAEKQAELELNAKEYVQNIQILTNDDWVHIYEERAFITFYAINEGTKCLKDIDVSVQLYDYLDEVIMEETVRLHTEDLYSDRFIIPPNYISSGIISIEEDVLRNWSQKYELNIRELTFYEQEELMNDGYDNKIEIFEVEYEEYTDRGSIRGKIKNISENIINSVELKVIYKNEIDEAIASNITKVYTLPDFNTEMKLENGNEADFFVLIPDYLFFDDFKWSRDFKIEIYSIS